MARISKTSTEKENRVKKVCESGRPSKRGNSSKDESDRNKRACSPSNFQKNSEVTRKTRASNAIEALKQKRKANAAKKERKEQPSKSDRKTRSSAISADSSRHSPRRRASSPEPIVPKENFYARKEVSSLQELMPATITRGTISKFLYAPFFDSTVIGCYVRLAQGAARSNQLSYIIWKIVGVEELDVVYEIDNKPTNKCIRCQRGSEERLFRMKFVSNTPIQPIEFVDWLVCNKSSGIPTNNMIDMKKADLHKALTHRYQHDEVEEMIKARKQFQKAPSKFALNKVELLRQKALACQSGDVEDAFRLQQEIDELDRASEALDKKRTKASSMVTLINKRNRAEMKNHVESDTVNEHAESDPFSRKRGHTRVVAGTKPKSTDAHDSSSGEVAEITQPSSATEPQLPPANITKPESVSMTSFHNVDLDIDLVKLTEIDAHMGVDMDMDMDMDMDPIEAPAGTSAAAQSVDMEISGPSTSSCI